MLGNEAHTGRKAWHELKPNHGLKPGKGVEGPHNSFNSAGVVELVYTVDSKSTGRKPMRVQIPPPAPTNRRGRT